MRIRSVFSHATQALVEGALIAAIVVVAVAGTTLAARGGGGGHKGGGGTSGGGTVALVMVSDSNGNGAPNWNDTITFNVSTTATNSPYLRVTCYQGGTVVYGADAGFYDSYPWPGARNMPLSSPSWTGGAADCKAVLNDNLATLSFHVDA